MKVKNINIISDNTCKCGIWLELWEKVRGRKALFCSEKNCVKSELIGAYVQKETPDTNWYIIPLCKIHSAATGELEVAENTVFVPANNVEESQKNFNTKQQSIKLKHLL